MTKRDAPGLILEKRAGAFRPVSQFDAEQMAAYPDGTEFDAKPRAKRSLPHQRKYWAMLSDVVAASALGDRYPTSAHLHEALLRELGYVRVAYDLDGKPYITRDSTSFDAMNQVEFGAYYERATARLAEIIGADPDSLSARKDEAA